MDFHHLVYFENEEMDPYYNLAVEEYLLREYSSSDPLFLLWRNEPVVVVGRNQNTYEEINFSCLNERGIKVVRRLSGGGAVYHDPGNLNFTFIYSWDRPGFDFVTFTRPILNILKRMGIEASLAGRNDLLIGDRKISGNAQILNRGRILHHGTLLFHTNIEIMNEVLHVSSEKFQSRGISSIRSRVANIADHLPENTPVSDILSFRDDLLKEMEHEIREDLIRNSFSEDQKKRIRELRDQKYRTWEWNFGESPRFDVQVSRQFSWGHLSLGFKIVHGRIVDGHFFGDFFALRDPQLLIDRIQDLPFERKYLEKTVPTPIIQTVFPYLTLDDLMAMIFT